MDLEEQGNGSIAGESASPNSNFGDADVDPDLNRSEESEVFANSEGSIPAPHTQVSPSISVESSSSAKQPSNNTSPVMFASASKDPSPQNSVTKVSSKSPSSPRSEIESKISPKTHEEESPTQIERLQIQTDENPKSPLVANLSPKVDKSQSPKTKNDAKPVVLQSSEVDDENCGDCTCWRRPLLDQIFITDVTSNLVTVTVRECYTDQGFFRKRT